MTDQPPSFESTTAPDSTLVEPWPIDDPRDCHFYHTLEIPGAGVFEGHVDLRPGVQAYLGGVPLAGQRVLEIGPASGFLTFHMEQAGAEVVALEVPDDEPLEMVPQPDLDLAAIHRDRIAHMRAIKRGFWFAHRRHNSRVRVYSGHADRLPTNLGRFDVVILGGVLLHCQNPVAVLHACTAVTDGAIVVTEQAHPALMRTPKAPLCWFAPSRANRIWDVWWRFSPGFVLQALELLGWTELTWSIHDQLSRGQAYQHFTVVGRKSQ
jgi:hypothetical protein